MDKNRKCFKKGDTILIDKPFVHVLKSTFKNEKCDYCFSEASLSRCSGCQYVFYCNHACQKSSWSEHKRECPKMKKIYPRVLPDAARIMSKILIKLKNGGKTEKSYYTSNRYKTFKDLMSHYPDLKEDTHRLEHFSTLYEVLKEYMGEANLPNAIELLGIYGRMCINAFNILDDNLNTIGTGIYLAASVLNHSCVPNATATFDGIKLRIGAIMDIEHSDPELHVFISYLELMQTTQERRRELQNNYYFLCECKRCTINYEKNYVNSMICTNTNCQAAVPMKNKLEKISDSIICLKCSEKINKDKVQTFFDVTDFTEFQLNRMKDIGYLDVCKMCLEKQSGIFHPNNINHIKILDLAFESAIKMEQWKESLKYGILLIDGYRVYYGECHPSLGILYMKLFKISSIVENAETAVKYLKKGMSILKITHGEDHSLYKNEVIPYCKELIRWFKRNRGFEKIDDLDLSACFDSFNKHWQQTFEIIDRFQTSKGVIKYDDIVAVINHLNQLIKLLLLDVQSSKSTNQSRCLEYFLHNQLLGKLYSWSLKTDRYKNYLKLEQLKIYGVLLSEFRGHQLLSDDSILNPLLLILNSYDGDCLSVEIEKHLVTVLRQFCVVLSHHPSVLSNVLKENTKNSKCVILSLLMAFIHRDGSIGEEARDALLIFVSLSRQNDILANIITSKSNVSPVLATGLSGLYSVLPRKLDIENDCYRLSPENIEDVPELNNFLASVELCNAVAKICHKTVYDQLLDYLYHGFLLPVVGPALMQVAEEEVATATVYLDLLLRSVSHPGLLQTFVKFVLCERFEKIKIIELLVNRINNKSFKVCIATLALMETILDLNCEDVMLELVLKYLVPCTHIMLSQRSRIKQVDSYCKSADIFLSLMPDVFKHRNIDSQTLYSEYRSYLNCARIKIAECALETKHWTYLYDGENPSHTIVEIKTNDVENDQNSILSADDSSSGYESFKATKDIDKLLGTDDSRPDEVFSNTSSPCGSDSSTCFIRQSTFKPKEPFTHYPCLGPFLEALFSKLENMPDQDFRINLRLTAVMTRLSIYNKPLIQSLLLNHSMIFQPCIRSLFQILRSLKQTIETKLSGRMDKIIDAEAFLIERENKLSNTQSNRSTCGKVPDAFARGETKRRSISIAFGAMFRRNSGHKEAIVESTNNGYRYYRENETESLDLPINAIILAEWLKELSAICQEHTIS